MICLNKNMGTEQLWPKFRAEELHHAIETARGPTWLTVCGLSYSRITGAECAARQFRNCRVILGKRRRPVAK